MATSASERTSPALELGAFIDRSPSPYHAVASVAELLGAAGFEQMDEADAWGPGDAGFVCRGGSLVAWRRGADADPLDGFRIVGAHTDSPNLRIKPQPDTGAAGVSQLGVEVYGGVLLNSWLDRDLGISGRVAVAGDGLEARLLNVSEPVLRVPQLAIHLHREINDSGLKLNRQTHMAPLWMDGGSTEGAFASWVAERLGIDAAAIRGWDLMAHDLTPASLLGADSAFLAAPRIDNLASCYAGTLAITSAPVGRTAVLCLFDHEEVGSVSRSGAGGSLLPAVVERLHTANGGDRSDLQRALAVSACISADGAHATHPNYVDRHEPDHQVALNGGPVIKRNANERYATDAMGQAIAEEACREADVPFQLFVNRTDLACGSTIGPVTAAQLGVTTVDMGIAQLSMHSARELCGASDPGRLTAALTAFYRS